MDAEPPRNPQEMFDLICRTFEQLRDAPMRMPHGYTDQDPHLFHPLEGRFYHRYCAACGLPREWLPAGAAVADLITLAEVLEVPPIRPETIEAMMKAAAAESWGRLRYDVIAREIYRPKDPPSIIPTGI